MNADTSHQIILGARERRRFESAGLWFRILGFVQLVGSILALLALLTGALRLQANMAELIVMIAIVSTVLGGFLIVEIVQARALLQAGSHARWFASKGERGELRLLVQRLQRVFVIEGILALLALAGQLL